MVENDYLMRLTHEIVRTWLKLLFGIDEIKEEEVVFEHKDSGDLYRRLKVMVQDGKVNEAENLLYDYLESDEERRRLENLKLALCFYDYVNRKNNEFLEDCSYSREEIREGICNVMRRYGYGELADTWADEW